MENHEILRIFYINHSERIVIDTLKSSVQIKLLFNIKETLLDTETKLIRKFSNVQKDKFL